MSTNNIYFVDMEKRFEDFQNNRIDLRALHVMVYDTDNVALALRQLSKSPGRMALGPDKTNIKTLEPYSIQELAEIVKDRLTNRKAMGRSGLLGFAPFGISWLKNVFNWWWNPIVKQNL